jgi:hypothetical protein
VVGVLWEEVAVDGAEAEGVEAGALLPPPEVDPLGLSLLGFWLGEVEEAACCSWDDPACDPEDVEEGGLAVFLSESEDRNATNQIAATISAATSTAPITLGHRILFSPISWLSIVSSCAHLSMQQKLPFWKYLFRQPYF